jgi:hypothetical protein
VCAFIREERGGGTVMGLMWFMVIVGIGGLAVDGTNGFRNRTMMQATADSAALAGAIDLPNVATAVATAVSYSVDNMPVAGYGEVLQPQDVEVGTWDVASRTLSVGGVVPDAVRVRLHQTEANTNAVPVSFLRIIGLQTWDVNVESVAQRFIPKCLKDGLVAAGVVEISSNNAFVNQICVHGQQGVNMQNHNSYESGVTVSMPKPGNQLSIPNGGMESNPGLPDALRENILLPRDVNHIDEFIAKLRDPSLDTGYVKVIPSYIDASKPVIAEDDKIDFTALNFAEGKGRIYDIDCKGKLTVTVPGITISNVVIVIECSLNVTPGATLNNVVLASYRTSKGQDPRGLTNISVAADVQLGNPDDCKPGGGVQIFSAASVQIASSAVIDGLQIVAAGDIDLGTNDQGVNGISAQAGGDIFVQSNNVFGLCVGGTPNLFTMPYYRLVK